MEEIKLTQYSHGAGCGCKISHKHIIPTTKISNNMRASAAWCDITAHRQPSNHKSKVNSKKPWCCMPDEKQHSIHRFAVCEGEVGRVAYYRCCRGSQKATNGQVEFLRPQTTVGLWWISLLGLPKQIEWSSDSALGVKHFWGWSLQKCAVGPNNCFVYMVSTF